MSKTTVEDRGTPDGSSECLADFRMVLGQLGVIRTERLQAYKTSVYLPLTDVIVERNIDSLREVIPMNRVETESLRNELRKQCRNERALRWMSRVGKHQCEALPLYLPGATVSNGQFKMAEAAIVRNDALKAGDAPFLQHYRLADDTDKMFARYLPQIGVPRAWYSPAFSDGCPLMNGSVAISGTTDKTAGQCDEFPNYATFEAGPSLASRGWFRKQPAVTKTILGFHNFNEGFKAFGPFVRKAGLDSNYKIVKLQPGFVSRPYLGTSEYPQIAFNVLPNPAKPSVGCWFDGVARRYTCQTL
jgi:hypothetical protein